MSLLAQLAIAAAIFIAGVAGGIKWHAGQDAIAAEAQREADAKQSFGRAEKSAKIEGDKDDEIRAIRDRLDVALDRLRKRPERPATPSATCSGASGSELSGPDATFLEREAARADTLRAALRACYDYTDALKPQN